MPPPAHIALICFDDSVELAESPECTLEQRFFDIGEEHAMTMRIVLAGLLAIGLASSANAGVPVAPLKSGSGLTRVAEGCGPGRWRGPGGRCHPMFDGRACPPGYHLGPDHRRCWPN
jgi:hypothetical protein